jgi:hypothetical protein
MILSTALLTIVLQSWPHIRSGFTSIDSTFRDLYLEAQAHAANTSETAGELLQCSLVLYFETDITGTAIHLVYVDMCCLRDSLHAVVAVSSILNMCLLSWKRQLLLETGLNNDEEGCTLVLNHCVLGSISRAMSSPIRSRASSSTAYVPEPCLNR